jgi:hypothetical protein
MTTIRAFFKALFAGKGDSEKKGDRLLLPVPSDIEFSE